MFSIKLHSVIDVITNSSTEIFTFHDDSVKVFDEMVNEMIKTFSPDDYEKGVRIGDIFYRDVFGEEDRLIDYILDENYDGKIENYSFKDAAKEFDIILESVLKGEIEAPSYFREDSGGTTFYILAKNSKYAKLAELIKEFLNSSQSEEGHY